MTRSSPPVDGVCPKCGLRSCRVYVLTAQLDRIPIVGKPLTVADFANIRTRTKLEQEITVAQDNCDAFAKARKQPS